MKKIVLFAMGLVLSGTTLAQEEKKSEFETTIKGDFVNEYIWRGLKLADVAVQPTFGVEYKGLSLTAWGSYGLSNKDDVKEFDLTLAYAISGLNFGVTDYWFSVGQDPEGRYFKYDAHGTNHIFEAFAGYDFGFASVKWYTNFTGNDYKENVPFRLATVDWTATAGAVPFESVQYGTNGFAVTNLSLRATKDIRITDTFSVPIFGQVIANPCSQKAYLVLGFTLQP